MTHSCTTRKQGKDKKLEVEPIRNMTDVKRMYNYLLVESTPREAECWIIGCNLALRAGDLLRLRFDQMGGDKVIINEQKTGKRKEFPVTKPVREAVARLQTYYDSKDFNATYLFQSTSNRTKNMCQPICIQWLGKAYKSASAGLGLDFNINTHSMRKTWGYHAYERGEDILYIQALLNHSHQHVTLRYIGVTKTAIQKMYHINSLEIA